MKNFPRQKTKLLICDLDNTLYDWVAYFVPAFYGMIEEIEKISGVDRETLLNDFREVHRRHGDSEHPFSLLETNFVKKIHPRSTTFEISRIYDSAFHKFNKIRKEKLKLYNNIIDTLKKIESMNINVIAHTESKLHAVIDRVERLNLKPHFNKIYCRERTSTLHPSAEKIKNRLSKFPMDRVVELTQHQRKPNTEVLLEICRRENSSPSETAYVGDSISRDILMANSASVCSIWAKYGTIHPDGYFEKLVRISHWSEEDVDREIQLKKKSKSVSPDFVLNDGFEEILECLREN